jgi:hypothetical protein
LQVFHVRGSKQDGLPAGGRVIVSQGGEDNVSQSSFGVMQSGRRIFVSRTASKSIHPGCKVVNECGMRIVVLRDVYSAERYGECRLSVAFEVTVSDE